MIKSIKHKGLRKYFCKGQSKGLDQTLLRKIKDRLDVLDAATKLEDLTIPSFDFHPYKGGKKGGHKAYTIHVNGPCVMTFKFIDGDVYDLDLESSH